MARKIELHLDALVAIALLIVAAVGFIAYQRHQYLDLLQDNIDRQWKQMALEFEVARLEAQLKKAASEATAASGAPQEQKKP
ncbi:MAG TPA: hypothetical protein VFO57_06865 [Burkholderiales bacterium]|nr:hypothetical protein [Burkholderiales bacterium]